MKHSLNKIREIFLTGMYDILSNYVYLLIFIIYVYFFIIIIY